MKMDARVRATKKALREALFQILKTEKMGAITVKQVCETADVSRATFYKHYKDCYDLLTQIEDEIVENFQKKFDMMIEKEPHDMVETLYKMMAEQREMCTVLFKSGEQTPFFHRLIDQAWQICCDELYNRFTNLTHTQAEVMFNAMAHGFLYLVMEGTQKCSQEEVSAMIEKMCQAGIQVFQ